MAAVLRIMSNNPTSAENITAEDAATFSVSLDTTSSFEEDQNRRVRRVQQRWRCDVCKAVTFPSLQEACVHEEDCRRQMEEKAIVAAGHSILDCSNEEEISSDSLQHEQHNLQPNLEVPMLDLSRQFPVVKGSRTRRQTRKTSSPIVEILDDESTSDTCKWVTKKPLPSKRPIKKKAKLDCASVSAFPMNAKDRKLLLQEHAAVEFRAKRLRKEQEQREKQQRKLIHQQHNQRKNGVERSTNTNLVAATASNFTGNSHITTAVVRPLSGRCKEKHRTAVRFPTKSYIFTHNEFDEVFWEDATQNKNYILENRFQTRSLKIPSQTIDDVPLSSDASYPFVKDSPTIWEPLLHLLASALIPPVAPVVDLQSTSSSQLWADKYATFAAIFDTSTTLGANTMNNDKLGFDDSRDTEKGSTKELCKHNCLSRALQSAAVQMRNFVESWKGERHRANQRAEARHDKLSKTKKVRKKPQRQGFNTDDHSNSNDLLWYDSDEDAQSRRNNLCLLTGPVGCGKTRLIHTVAQWCNCNVLELNTTEKRGAASLKRSITEATQSHSSLDLLKKKEKIAKSMLLDNPEMLDNDEMPEDLSVFGAASLTLILIDEADILFEEHGDNGFWPALTELSRRAKCPIFLTANNVGVVTSALGATSFTHISVNRPSPAECVPFIKNIIASEGFVLRAQKDHSIDYRLEMIADYCCCDWRKIANELQLFAFSVGTKCFVEPNALTMSECQEIVDSEIVKKSEPVCSAVNLSLVKSVRPSGVRAEVHNIVTIEGTGFLQLASLGVGGTNFQVRVHFEDLICLAARIMSNSTILAVVPPFPLPSNLVISVNRLYREKFCRSYSAEYKRISISSMKQLGLTSSTAGMLSWTRLPDERKMLSLEPDTNLVLHFSTVTGYDEQKFNFEETNREKAADTNKANTELITDMLNSAVENWKDKFSADDNETLPFTNSTSGLEYFERLSYHAALASDAALFEDVGASGIPFLSGASLGFGFDYTDASASTNNRPLSEERLFHTGWKDSSYFYGDADWFVTLPSTAREQLLLKKAESSLRGKAFVHSDAPSATENLDSEDNNPPPTYRSDEDSLLSNIMPNSLQSFAKILRKADELVVWSSDDLSRDRLFEMHRLQSIQSYLHLASTCLFHSKELQCKLFAQGLLRIIDPLIAHEAANTRLFLDYFPLLRIICVHEQQPPQKLERDVPSFSNRPATRRATKMRAKSKIHCLERLTCGSKFDAKAIGDQLASSCLALESHDAKFVSV